jgi:hypothetical protein
MKTNNETASLRLGNKPKAEKVRTLPLKGGKEAIEAAEKQNLMDGKTGKGNLAQIPAGREYPTTTGSGN